MRQATEKQKNYIETLLMKKHPGDVKGAIAELKPCSSEGRFTTLRQAMRNLSAGRASEIISALLDGRNVPLA